jgi:hypothetical protein
MDKLGRGSGSKLVTGYRDRDLFKRCFYMNVAIMCRKSDYPKVLRRGVAVMVILLLLLLLLFGAFAPVAVTHISLPAWWKGGEEGER